MLTKNINLLFEDIAINAEYNTNSALVTLKVDEFKLNAEKSKTDHEVYETVTSAEIYLDVEEVKEIIKALQNILPEEDKKYESTGIY